MTSAVYPENRTHGTLIYALAIAVGIFSVLGFIWANSGEQLFAYFLVLFAAIIPGVLWIRMGTPGVPVLPVLSLAYIPYFGWPILTSSEVTLDYTAWEILRSALSVALFLSTAAIAAQVTTDKKRLHQPMIEQRALDTSRVVQFQFVGLLVGIAFHIGAIYGLQGWLGSLFGSIRSVALTLTIVSCLLVGVIRGQGHLQGKAWAASIACVVLLVILTWSSLFLVGGMIYSMAVIFGYVIAAKRVPWMMVATIVIAVTVLHAGKGEMRDKYWEPGTNFGGVYSVWAIPGFLVEWTEDGLAAMTNTRSPSYQTPLERASLIQIMLRVQSETPDRIDYLLGETYSYLPGALIPRFIDADKPASQVAMDLLNVRYGLLTIEEAAKTAVGWGLLAESYANFGYFGIIGIGLLLGVLCGRLQSWSANALPITLPTLASVAIMMTLVNLEADSIQVCTTMLQSFVSVIIFLAAFRRFAIR